MHGALDLAEADMLTARGMSSGNPSLSVVTPAKINLFLDILGRREDGYHVLRSIVMPISLCDRLTLEATDGIIETRVSLKHLPWEDRGLSEDPNSNLATRAARLLKEATGYPGGVRIDLEKYVPIGGGLGGGSADAAGALVGLNQLWGTGLSREDLMRLGVRLGCDVPALVHGGGVCMEGAGDRVSPLTDAQGRISPCCCAPEPGLWGPDQGRLSAIPAAQRPEVVLDTKWRRL